jgi:hypothetical protein
MKLVSRRDPKHKNQNKSKKQDSAKFDELQSHVQKPINDAPQVPVEKPQQDKTTTIPVEKPIQDYTPPAPVDIVKSLVEEYLYDDTSQDHDPSLQEDISQSHTQESPPQPPLQQAPPPSPKPQPKQKPQAQPKQKPPPPQAPHEPQQKHSYPKASLSDKQMAALHSVIKQPEKKKKNADTPIVIEEGKRSVVRTVLIISLIVVVLSTAGFAGWYYWWTTYATFEHTVHPVVVLDGQSVAAEEFLYTGAEMAGVKAEFQNPDFETAAGLQYIPLTLTLGLRTVETSAALYVLTPVEYILHEFTETGSTVRPIDTLINPEAAARASFDVHFIENPLPLEDYPVGDFILHLALNDTPFEVILRVVDTTPPTATPVDHTIQIGDAVHPEDFVTDVFDASPIESITFVEEPDVFMRGENQSVQVAIDDIFGNTAIFSAELTILLNQMPPVIEGVTGNVESEVRVPIDYLSGVTAHDDFGRALEVHVDNSEVDENTEGTYTALIWAEDYTGLRTEVEVVVHVLSVSPEYINERIDEILARTINDRMNQEEKALAIHNWVRWTLSPSTTESASQSVLAGAYHAIQERSGDSLVYASISEMLLTRAGIPNMRITRIPEAEKAHFWMIINPDDKGWHHFDPFPTGISLSNRTSMFTNAQAAEFAQRIEALNGTKDYFTYDAELYPEIVKE